MLICVYTLTFTVRVEASKVFPHMVLYLHLHYGTIQQLCEEFFRGWVHLGSIPWLKEAEKFVGCTLPFHRTSLPLVIGRKLTPDTSREWDQSLIVQPVITSPVTELKMESHKQLFSAYWPSSVWHTDCNCRMASILSTSNYQPVYATPIGSNKAKHRFTSAWVDHGTVSPIWTRNEPVVEQSTLMLCFWGCSIYSTPAVVQATYNYMSS